MILVITDVARKQRWIDCLGLDKRTHRRDGIFLSTIEEGRMHWEVERYSIVLVDEGISLNKEDCMTLFSLHGHVISMHYTSFVRDEWI